MLRKTGGDPGGAAHAMIEAMDGLRILLAGDVMTGRGIDQVLPHAGDPRLFERWVQDARDYVRIAERANGAIARPVPPAAVWGEALAHFTREDIAWRIVNLETAITQGGEPWPDKGIHYRMHPGNVDVLAAARIDACALANNHVMDWGLGGLRETLSVLQATGIHGAGAGLDAHEAWSPAVLQRAARPRVLLFSFAAPTSGVPFAWAAAPARPGVAFLPDFSAASLARVRTAIERHRVDGDLVLVSLHWGGNWGLAIPPEHRSFAHALVEAGCADIVHGHSSHHPLAVEVHGGRLVLYGCGDLLNDYEGIATQAGLRSDAGCVYVAELAPGGALARLEIVPFRTRRFSLHHADAPARAWLCGIFDGGPFGTRIAEQEDGRWELVWA